MVIALNMLCELLMNANMEIKSKFNNSSYYLN